MNTQRADAASAIAERTTRCLRGGTGVFAVALSVGLLAGCGAKEQDQIETTAPVPVVLSSATRGPIHRVITTTGVVVPASGAELRVTPPQAARIAEMPLGVGEHVRRGELLVRFEIPALASEAATRHADLERAHARLVQAQRSFERVQGLFERGIAARRELDDAQRELAEATAGVAEGQGTAAAAARALGSSDVRAPFDGIVAERSRNPGDQVEAGGEPVLRLIDPARLEVTVALPAEAIAWIAVGSDATVRGPGGDPEAAKVFTRPAVLDTATMSGTARLRFAKPTALAAGTPVEVALSGEEHRDAVTVPAVALVQEGRERFVFTVDAEHRAHRNAVEVGIVTHDDVEILSGVAAGDQVVIEGANGLPDGAEVSVGGSESAQPAHTGAKPR